MPTSNYSLGVFLAILAAISASLVGIFGELGMKDIDSSLATAIRSVVMTLVLLVIVSAMGLWSKLPTVKGAALGSIVLAGIAGAASWLFGFAAIKLIGVSKTMPIDKLSVPLSVVLAVWLFHEQVSPTNWVGIVLIAAGAYLAAME